MTPDERLDQLEPALADGLQKIDRLIENQGLLVNDVSKIPGIEKNIGVVAKGVIDLTANVNSRFDEVQQDIADLKAGQALILEILKEKLP